MRTIDSTEPLAVEIVSSINAGEISALQRLLAEHPWAARAGITDDRGVTRSLLHIATDWPGHFSNGPEVVRTLASAGASPNARTSKRDSDELGETPLHWAASSNDVQVLDALLDVGADLEAMGAVLTDGSPMANAVVFAQWDAARRLLERGATTTLWQASALGLVDRVEQALEEHSEPSDREITNALWHACRGGHRATAEVLLARGAEVNWVGYDGRTPLDAAQESGSTDLPAWLRDVGAKSGSELA